MKLRSFSITACILTITPVIAYLAGQSSPSSTSDWTVAGQDRGNLRFQAAEQSINAQNAPQLNPKWVFTTGGDVSATPTVASGVVYVPDSAGNLFAVRSDNGQMIWSHQISEYDQTMGAFARVSPAVYQDEIIIGDIQNSKTVHNGANVIAVSSSNGALRWITKIDSHPAAVITGSPVVFNDTVYVGVSSNEEGLADTAGYPCCTFRGSVVALNATNGQIKWQRYVVPDNGGQTNLYSGGAIWQPPAIDAARGSLYVGTGNNYTAPAAVEACQSVAATSGDPSVECTDSNDFFDTALSLDLNTGAVKWSKKLKGYDVWTVACTSPKPGVTCPSPAGPDYDLGGSGPNLLGNMVGFGQKSGIYWALDPASGEILWSTIVGPGGTLGGIEWGTASDKTRIYAAISNSTHKAYALAPNGTTANGGSWAALDVVTGAILWQTADPSPGVIDPGSVSVANGVVYAGSFSGSMYGLDAASGRIVWSFASGGSVIDGPAIVNGTLFWGSVYKKISPGIGNNKLYAFAIPSQASK